MRNWNALSFLYVKVSRENNNLSLLFLEKKHFQDKEPVFLVFVFTILNWTLYKTLGPIKLAVIIFYYFI